MTLVKDVLVAGFGINFQCSLIIQLNIQGITAMLMFDSVNLYASELTILMSPFSTAITHLPSYEKKLS